MSSFLIELPGMLINSSHACDRRHLFMRIRKFSRSNGAAKFCNLVSVDTHVQLVTVAVASVIILDRLDKIWPVWTKALVILWH